MSEFWKDGPTGNMSAPAAPAADAVAAPAAAPQTEFWKSSAAIGQGGTAEQARQMAEALVASGAMTREAADAGLKAGGNAPAPADTRTDAQKNFDATFAPPPAPEGYKLDYIGRLPAGADTNAVALFNGAATSWLHEIQMPANIGAATLERALETGRRLEGLSGPALALWKQEQAVAFDRAAKTPERAAQLRAYAAEVLTMQTKSPEFSAGLLKSGARYDASVLMNLALHGERLAQRAKL